MANLNEADFLIHHQSEQLETLMIKLALSLAELERLQSTQQPANQPAQGSI